MARRQETRGRKSLADGEETVRAAVCLRKSMFDYLCTQGDKGDGYGALIRDAVEEKYGKKVRRKRKT